MDNNGKQQDTSACHWQRLVLKDVISQTDLRE